MGCCHRVSWDAGLLVVSTLALWACLRQAEAQPKKPAVDACPDGMYQSSDTRQCEPIKGLPESKPRGATGAESLQSPVTSASSPEEARAQLECWTIYKGGPKPYANYAMCTGDIVATALVREFGRESNFAERYLAFRLETYRSIDSESLTVQEAQRLREDVIASERRHRLFQQIRVLEAQGYRCSQAGPTQVQCLPPQNDLAGAAAILQGFAAGWQQYAPASPLQCETRQTVSGRFPQWTTTCK